MKKNDNRISALDHATGEIRYNMTNDFMFKTVLQRSNHVLIRLLCSLLHLEESAIKSAIVTNPIVPGELINDKTVILDVMVLMNDNTNVNLEMQVINHHNWTDRSVYYLCRSFTNLVKADNYRSVKPSYQIGFLDYTLFPDEPEFYANYLLMNTRSHKVYNDKFRLSVVSLSQIDLATEEDRRYHIDDWARLFKATTWEDLKMMGTNDSVFQEAGTVMYEVSEDEHMRQILEAREDARRNENDLLNYIQERIDEAEAKAEAQAEAKAEVIAEAKAKVIAEAKVKAAQQAAKMEVEALQKKLDLYRSKYGDL